MVQMCTYFPKIRGPAQNSRYQKGGKNTRHTKVPQLGTIAQNLAAQVIWHPRSVHRGYSDLIFKGQLSRKKFFRSLKIGQCMVYSSVPQTPGRGPVPGPGINYTGPREIVLELITNLNVILYLSTCHTVHISVLIINY